MRTRGAPITRPWHPLPESFRRTAASEPGAILLETARFDEEDHQSLLFRKPTHELIARASDEVEQILAQIDSELQSGHYVAGFVSYECGELFHGLSSRTRTLDDPPLIRMGVFDSVTTFDHRHGSIAGPNLSVAIAEPRDPAKVLSASLEISEQTYTARIAQVQQYLAAGHSYQVNLTDRIAGAYSGQPAELYALLIQQQPVSFAAYLNYGDHQLLSLSPELFYRNTRGRLTVRPMKGTWPRGLTLAEDDHAAQSLFHDPKNRAEHTTIVDLLRNDIGKVSRLGSVRVDTLMQIERHRTLLQMTSTITGEPDPCHSPTEVLRALFPSGSITGAPKRRTMEIIRELESTPRGVYTGAIGWFGPNGQACFNVAIRTLLVHGSHYTMGVGGGITADSNAKDEYEECKLKAAFLQRATPPLILIETMRASSGHIALLERHLQRLLASAAYFHIAVDPIALRRSLSDAVKAASLSELRVRLTLDENGLVAIHCAPLEVLPWNGNLILSSTRVDSSNVFLYHKTSNRQIYEEALAEARVQGFDEVLFQNQYGFVTEGAISNLFLETGGRTITPPIGHGLLPGIQRSCNLDEDPRIQEAAINLRDLQTADRIFVCNALRGNREVTTIRDTNGRLLWKAHSLTSAHNL